MTKKRVGCMLAYPFEAKRLAGYPKPYIVQPKLDGDRCRIVIKGGVARLLSSTEELVTGVPHISDSADHLALLHPHLELELDGELYCHGMDQNTIDGIVRRKYLDNLHPDYEKIRFNIFDVVNDKCQSDRLAEALKWCHLLSQSGVFDYVDFKLANSYDDVVSIYNSCIEDGYEGIIVRDRTAPYVRKRSTQMMKFKAKKKDYYRIVGVNEAISEDGTPLEMLGSFECEDTMGSTFKVGAGQLNHEHRRYYWQIKDAIINGGWWCKVGYQNLTAKRRVPRHGLCINVSVTKENPEED